VKPLLGSVRNSQKFAIAGLLALSAVPLLAGIIRLTGLFGEPLITDENARFLASPIPVVVHIISSMLYCIFGAFQFSSDIRKLNLNWHRMSGRLLVPMGLLSAISGLWMTQFYPFTKFDGQALYLIRLLVGFCMSVFILLGVAAILKKRISAHQAWMMRAYGLGLGAGTQVFTHIPWAILTDMQSEIFRTICMASGWAINIIFVEWLISRRPLKK